MFHIIIHARPADTPEPDIITIDGQSLEVLRISALSTRFAIAYEELHHRMSRLDRMFLEPDGSFVWVGQRGAVRRQMDGMVYDDGERVLAIEIKSNCDEAWWDCFLSALGWPTQRVLIQWVPRGVYLEECEFRRRFLN